MVFFRTVRRRYHRVAACQPGVATTLRPANLAPVSDKSFFGDEGKRAVKDAVRAIEETTAAEVVVAVRKRSWRYRHTHYLFGFVISLLVLIALLFLPQSFDIATWPLEIGGAFIGGALLCAVVPPLERLLTEPGVMETQVARAAKAAFVDMGITRTHGRTGLLVYLSLRERRAELVGDVALGVLETDDGYKKARTGIEAAAAEADLDAFVAALRQLAAPLAAALPRREDDVNELPDEAA
jgi:putative membrane protein